MQTYAKQRSSYNVWQQYQGLTTDSLSRRTPWYSFAYGDLIDSMAKSPWGNGDASAGLKAGRTVGLRYYELSDHLGNVLATVLDRKTGHYPGYGLYYDYWTADVASAQDYYPFGMEMTGRTYTASIGLGSKYGFNGQQRSDEVYGKGNLNTALFWEYDTRLARRWNVDPVDQIKMSNYSVVGGNPIQNTDPKGDCFWCMALIQKVVGAVNTPEKANTTANSLELNGPARKAFMFWSGGVAASPLNSEGMVTGFVSKMQGMGSRMANSVVSNPLATITNPLTTFTTSEVKAEVQARLSQVQTIRQGGDNGFYQAGSLTAEAFQTAVAFRGLTFTPTKYLYRQMGPNEFQSFQNAGGRFTPNPSGTPAYFWEDVGGLKQWESGSMANGGPSIRVGVRAQKFNALGLEMSDEAAFPGTPRYFVVPVDKLSDFQGTVWKFKFLPQSKGQ